MRVLVTDGDSRAALAVTRALGRAGHWVAVAERTAPALAQTSKFCASVETYPDPAQNESAFVDALAALIDRLRIDVLMPTADVVCSLVSEHRSRFSASCRIPLPPRPVLARAADKIDVLRTAMRLGIPVPQTVFLESRRDAGAVDLPFPVVVKGRASRIRTASGWINSTVGYARTRAELDAAVVSRRDAEFPLAVQERVVGPGLGVFVCLDRSRVTGRFCHRRLREKPPSGGVSVLAESVAMDPVAETHAIALLKEIGWQGVAMVEFKRDERDGVPRLMEINGRFWGSLQLAIDAGVDFPNLLMATLSKDCPGLPPEYRTGVRTRWLWGDIDSLAIQLFGRSGSGGRNPAQGRLGALWDFLQLWDSRYENPRMDDIRPFVHETLGRLRPRA